MNTSSKWSGGRAYLLSLSSSAGFASNRRYILYMYKRRPAIKEPMIPMYVEQHAMMDEVHYRRGERRRG